MAERYSRLFSLEKKLYTPGAPVLISAGALLLDTFSSSMLAQLKFKNISAQTIRAMKVSILMLDTTGAILGAPVEYQYLDLKAARDDEFGSRTAIVLTSPNVRSFAVAVNEIVFEDGRVWRSDACDWLPLSAQISLEESYDDAELANQYRIRYGTDCKFTPVEDRDLWFCSCGAINRDSEKNCHVCRRTLSAQKTVNVSALRAECAERLAAEAERQIEEEALSQEKKKKQVKLAAIIAPIVIIALLLLAWIPGVVRRSQDYKNACELLAAHEFDQAAEAFVALDGYKDSAEQLSLNIPYQQACYIMDCAASGDDYAKKLAGISSDTVSDESLQVLMYRAAIEQFTALGDYKDSADRINQCEANISARQQAEIQAQYDQAAALLSDGSFCLAHEAFLALDDYSDSKTMAKEALYRKAIALYGFMEKYDVRKIYAEINTAADKSSSFVIDKSAAVSGCIEDLRAACGKDKADIDMLEEVPEGLTPFSESLALLFASLGSYSDSADYLTKIGDVLDYDKEFRRMCQEGDLHGAYNWLISYEEEFEGREHWMQLLELYKPFCSNWALHAGDSTLIPLTAGRSGPCGFFSSCVLLNEDSAVLRLSISEGEAYTVELSAPLGETGFSFDPDGSGNFYAAISNTGRFAYMKYNTAGSLVSSCEYEVA